MGSPQGPASRIRGQVSLECEFCHRVDSTSNVRRGPQAPVLVSCGLWDALGSGGGGDG